VNVHRLEHDAFFHLAPFKAILTSYNLTDAVINDSDTCLEAKGSWYFIDKHLILSEMILYSLGKSLRFFKQ